MYLFIMLSVKQDGIKYLFFFLVSGMIRPGIEPRSPGPLANSTIIGSYILFLMFTWANDFLLFFKLASTLDCTGAFEIYTSGG